MSPANASRTVLGDISTSVTPLPICVQHLWTCCTRDISVDDGFECETLDHMRRASPRSSVLAGVKRDAAVIPPLALYISTGNDEHKLLRRFM